MGEYQIFDYAGEKRSPEMGPDWGGGRERVTKLGKVFFIREREKAVDWVGYVY